MAEVRTVGGMGFMRVDQVRGAAAPEASQGIPPHGQTLDLLYLGDTFQQRFTTPSNQALMHTGAGEFTDQ